MPRSTLVTTSSIPAVPLATELLWVGIASAAGRVGARSPSAPTPTSGTVTAPSPGTSIVSPSSASSRFTICWWGASGALRRGAAGKAPAVQGVARLSAAMPPMYDHRAPVGRAAAASHAVSLRLPDCHRVGPCCFPSPCCCASPEHDHVAALVAVHDLDAPLLNKHPVALARAARVERRLHRGAVDAYHARKLLRAQAGVKGEGAAYFPRMPASCCSLCV